MHGTKVEPYDTSKYALSTRPRDKKVLQYHANELDNRSDNC